MDQPCPAKTFRRHCKCRWPGRCQARLICTRCTRNWPLAPPDNHISARQATGSVAQVITDTVNVGTDAEWWADAESYGHALEIPVTSCGRRRIFFMVVHRCRCRLSKVSPPVLQPETIPLVTPAQLLSEPCTLTPARDKRLETRVMRRETLVPRRGTRGAHE